MTQDTLRVRTPTFVQLHQDDHAAVRAEWRPDCRPVRLISPKYLYDALGSHLFEAITELPEYYPTRTEASIFARHAPAMARGSGRFDAGGSGGGQLCKSGAFV